MWLNDTSHTWLDAADRLPYVAKPNKQNVIATLAATAQKLIDDAGSQTKVGKGKGVKQRTLSRWASGKESNPRLSKLQDLATSVDAEVWQLLVPGFDPKHPPKLAGDDSGHKLKPEELDLILDMRAITPRVRSVIVAMVAADLAETSKATRERIKQTA